MEPEGSLSCLQELATGSYPELYRSNPHFSLKSFLIYPFHLRLDFPNGLFP
jgi:hypothetical protein